MTNAIDPLLLRELAAVESYELVLNELEPTDAAEIRRIREDHAGAVKVLREHAGAVDLPAAAPPYTAAREADYQGHLARTLTALKSAELLSATLFEAAADDVLVPSECREWIRRDLLTRLHGHVQMLDRLLGS